MLYLLYSVYQRDSITVYTLAAMLYYSKYGIMVSIHLQTSIVVLPGALAAKSSSTLLPSAAILQCLPEQIH
jgi:hypothetical protein